MCLNSDSSFFSHGGASHSSLGPLSLLTLQSFTSVTHQGYVADAPDVSIDGICAVVVAWGMRDTLVSALFEYLNNTLSICAQCDSYFFGCLWFVGGGIELLL
jgi:hypothetical protein